MSLINQIKLPLSALHQEKVEIIDNFDYSNVMRKVREEFGGAITEQYLLDGIENLKRYYVVALLDPTNRHAVSAVVDPFWHAHVLFTKDYHQFCEDVYDQYIHHTPLDHSDTPMVNHVRDLYTYTRDVYDEMFVSVDSNWWPPAGKYPDICYHMEVYSEHIRAQALFPKNPELEYVPA